MSPTTAKDYLRLTAQIDLTRNETYDCTRENVWSYRKATDIRDGINVKFGNMCNGFGFDFLGVPFLNSECAYISGSYASPNAESSSIQLMISKEANGQRCKRVYRRNPGFTRFERSDFYTFNVQWMLFVLWQKSMGNPEFARLLRQMPVDSVIVENTTLHNGSTSSFWGAKNRELMAARHQAEDAISRNQSFRYKKDLVHALMIAANQINRVGSFMGQNVMGKIIKLCSLALIFSQEPPIDYGLLISKELFFMGKRIDFDRYR